MRASPTPSGMNPVQLPFFYVETRNRISPLPDPSVNFLLESLVWGSPAQQGLSQLPPFVEPLRDTPCRSLQERSSRHTLSQPGFTQLPLFVEPLS